MTDNERPWRTGIPTREVVEALMQAIGGSGEAVTAFRARESGFASTVFAYFDEGANEVRFDRLAPMPEAPNEDGSSRVLPPQRVYPTEEWEFLPVDIWTGEARAWPEAP